MQNIALYRFIFTSALMIIALLLAETAHAQVDCSGTDWSVSNETEFNQAIACYNNKAQDSGTHQLTLSEDIFLNAPPTEINSVHSGNVLSIIGQGKTINGKNSHRPITIKGNSAVQIENAFITRGNASLGGGIYNSAALTLRNVTVLYNSANYGGGIYNSNYLRVFDSTIDTNSSSISGGGIFNESSVQFQLSGSTVSNNSTANEDGGGIYNTFEGLLSVKNSTVSGNKAGRDGGGIENWGTLDLVYATVSNNSAKNVAGGIENYGGSAVLGITNTIIANNNVNSVAGGDCVNNDGGQVFIAFNNVIEDNANTCGINDSATNGDGLGNIVGVDPNLGSLADNGGYTETHALLPGSPALAAGGNTTNSTDETDQRGFSRDFNTPDIGAFEAYGDCMPTSTSWNVTDAHSLVSAVLCFNQKNDNQTYTINLMNDISLRSSPLSNVASTLNINNYSAKLVIDGGAIKHKIDGAGKVRVIYMPGSNTDVTVNNAKITNGKGELGGGIYNRGKLTFNQCEISQNMAYNGGGIFNLGDLTLNNCVVNGNEVSNVGGGIINMSNAKAALTNTTVSSNKAARFGGGIDNDGDMKLVNSTISINSASEDGSGIRNNGNLKLTNTIIGHNSSFSDCFSTNNGIVDINSSHNLIQSPVNNCGLTATAANGNIIGEDPKLRPLTDYGGITKIHALLTGSPAIDAGTSVGAPVTDQRGLSRDAKPDIGAYEVRNFLVLDFIFSDGFE